MYREQGEREEYGDWESIPPPFPAGSGLPVWFQGMPGVSAEGAKTVKRCPPFLDAMASGYLIPFPDWAELRLKAPHEWDKRGPGKVFLGFHPRAQFPGAWWQEFAVVKFDSPWIIRTPPGYSTLFVPPLNRSTWPWQPLSGVVETDRYYSAVAFPMVLLDSSVGTVHRLERGTPLVQAIPFRRDEWQTSLGISDLDRWQQTQEMVNQKDNVYRTHWHVPKRFE